MQKESTKISLLKLIQKGLGIDTAIQKDLFWDEIYNEASKQGVSAIVLDGIGKLPPNQRPPQFLLLNWIGEALQSETTYEVQQQAAKEMADLFAFNGIRTYVLKGTVVAECYPRPEHRLSSDLDCFLIPEKGDFCAWEMGNELIKSKGYQVDTIHYINSTFYLPDLTVENHQFMTPFRGNRRLKNMEIMLQGMLSDDKGEDIITNTNLCRPPVMMTALFLIEHAFSHFLHEGLTWRMVLDWMMFSKKHKNEINWGVFETLVDEYGLKMFYISYYRIGQYLLGEMDDSEFSQKDKKMLRDIWNELDLNETAFGIRGKMGLAGNTIRAWWKYHYFSPISMPHALWIQVKEFLFDRHPSLT